MNENPFWGMNENPFWLALWKAVNDEIAQHTDSSIPLATHFVTALENIAQKVQSVGDWYRIAGIENPEPLPAEPPLNMFIFGVLLGNFLAWRSGVKFADRVTKDN